MGENKGQDVISSSRCLWNTEHDGSVSVSQKSRNMFIIATMYAIYMD